MRISDWSSDVCSSDFEERDHSEDDQDQKLVAQGKFDQAIQHGAPPVSGRRESMTMPFSHLCLEDLRLQGECALDHHLVARLQAFKDDGAIADPLAGTPGPRLTRAVGIVATNPDLVPPELQHGSDSN